MALELRPNCELCDRDLPADSPDARICSYECTYCVSCATGTLANVCPTCGGGFETRPIRPLNEWRAGSKLGRRHDPPSERRKHTSWTAEQIREFVEKMRGIEPSER
jgi:uncharacterized protein